MTAQNAQIQKILITIGVIYLILVMPLAHAARVNLAEPPDTENPTIDDIIKAIPTDPRFLYEFGSGGGYEMEFWNKELEVIVPPNTNDQLFSGNLSCNAFDPIETVKAEIKASPETGYLAAAKAIEGTANSIAASLPLMALAEANPRAHVMITNALHDSMRSARSGIERCQSIENALATSKARFSDNIEQKGLIVQRAALSGRSLTKPRIDTTLKASDNVKKSLGSELFPCPQFGTGTRCQTIDAVKFLTLIAAELLRQEGEKGQHGLFYTAYDKGDGTTPTRDDLEKDLLDLGGNIIIEQIDDKSKNVPTDYIYPHGYQRIARQISEDSLSALSNTLNSLKGDPLFCNPELSHIQDLKNKTGLLFHPNMVNHVCLLEGLDRITVLGELVQVITEKKLKHRLKAWRAFVDALLLEPNTRDVELFYSYLINLRKNLKNALADISESAQYQERLKSAMRNLHQNQHFFQRANKNQTINEQGAFFDGIFGIRQNKPENKEFEVDPEGDATINKFLEFQRSGKVPEL